MLLSQLGLEKYCLWKGCLALVMIPCMYNSFHDESKFFKKSCALLELVTEPCLSVVVSEEDCKVFVVGFKFWATKSSPPENQARRQVCYFDKSEIVDYEIHILKDDTVLDNVLIYLPSNFAPSCL